MTYFIKLFMLAYEEFIVTLSDWINILVFLF